MFPSLVNVYSKLLVICYNTAFGLISAARYNPVNFFSVVIVRSRPFRGPENSSANVSGGLLKL